MIAIFRRGKGTPTRGLRDLLSQAGTSAQEFLKATVENVGRATLKWALGVSISYLIAAALAIAALVFTLGAAADGLIAAGLPAFAADLILAALTGGTAFLFYMLGKNKKLSTARKKDDSRARNVPGLQIRIVRSRSAPGTVLDVHPAEDRGWEVGGRSGKHPRRTYPTKARAIRAARRAARKEKVRRVVVHRADGHIQENLAVGDSRKPLH